jgi:hypothetical protein
MDYVDKLELVGLAKSAMNTSLGENGIDESMIQIIHPNAKSSEDLDMNDLCILLYIEGYLHCKKENQNIIEIMMNEGKSASEIFSKLVGKDYVYDEETKVRKFKEL